MANNSTELGTVEDVKGSTVSVSLDRRTDSGLVFIEGKGYKIGQVGSFVRLPQGYKDLFGLVSQVGASAVPENKLEEGGGERWMTVQLIGEGTREGDFERGLTQYPAIGDPVHIVTEPNLERVYGRSDSPQFLEVGNISSSATIPALVDINKLVTRHSAVLGSTGSGKTTTVTSLLGSIVDNDFESARCIVLDIHGEYSSAFSEEASVFKVNPQSNEEKQLYIPYWALNFNELSKLTFGKLDDQKNHRLLEKVVEKKKETLDNSDIEVAKDEISADSPIPFSIHQLWFELHKKIISTHTEGGAENQTLETIALEEADGGVVEKGDPFQVIPPETKPHDGQDVLRSHSKLNIRRQIEGLASKLRDERLDFLFEPGDWTPDTDGTVEKDLDRLLEQWVGSENSISILDLSGIPPGILEILIGALLRIIYDSMFWAKNLSEGSRERPILFVLEEAHSYLGKKKKSSAASAVQRIVKEGRKYGMGAMVISQRPSEIDPTILSQCGTFFALRLQNQKDQSIVSSIAPDNLQGIFSMLPVLKTGEAIISGESVKLPTRAQITFPPPQRRPDSEDPVVFDEKLVPSGWDKPKEPTNYSEVISLWRKQENESEKIVDFDNNEE